MSKTVKISDFPKTKSLVSLSFSFSTVPSLFELHVGQGMAWYEEEVAQSIQPFV